MASHEDSIKDPKHYEDLIRRMKVLSVSQTTFLKAFVHWKLSAGVSLVQRSLDILGAKSGNNDPRVTELKNALLALKLNEIEVDVTSPQLMLSDEVSILRQAVDAGVDAVLGGGKNHHHPQPHANTSSMPIPPPVVNNHEDKEKIRSLEHENNNLRSLLKEVQNELAAMTIEQERKEAMNAKTTSSSSAETHNLQAKVSSLEQKIIELESSCQANDAHLSFKEEEMRRAVATAQSAAAEKSSSQSSLAEELAQARQQIVSYESQLQAIMKDHDAKLAAKIQEMNSTADKRVEEVCVKLEGEKEVMMDAMTQEVEAIEAAKTAEHQQLHNKIRSLESSLDTLRQSKDKLAASIYKVQANAQAIAQTSSTIKQDVKRDLADYQRFHTLMLNTSLITKIKALGEQFQVVNARYKRELTERKKLHNIIQELKGNIRVFMRCRPPTSKEIEQFGSEQHCVSFPNPGEVRVFNEKSREKSWEFDEVFGLNSTQDDVYRDVSDLVVSVLDGFNVCIFAYGQTGSGKTWTMSGPPENRGVNFRALNELFDRIQQRSADCNDTITVSILEVYNEEIRDLMVDPREQEKLDIRQGEHGNYVPGLTCVPVHNLDQVVDLLATADRFRSQTQTHMNAHSSRSHMMMTVQIVSESRITGITSRGKLNLVDLAGSERIMKSGVTGAALKEAQNINKSLSALGDVIAARAAKQNHVPFRNSTLTYLLQDSLSQDSKTLMIVCASPMLFNSEETFCSLNFASRVRTVELGKAARNASPGLPSSGGGGSSGQTISPSTSSTGIAAMANTTSAGSAGSRSGSASASSSAKRPSVGSSVR